MRFQTLSGSVYEFDVENKQVRRLYGTHAPLPRQGEDEVWKPYVAMHLLETGSIAIVWNITEDGVHQSTLTSRIVKRLDLDDN